MKWYRLRTARWFPIAVAISIRQTNVWPCGTFLVSGPDDIAQAVVKTINGTPLKIGDVADVQIGNPLPIGDAIINGGPGLLLIVEMYPWGNTLDVTRGVEAALHDLAPGLKDIEIDSRFFARQPLSNAR